MQFINSETQEKVEDPFKALAEEAIELLSVNDDEELEKNIKDIEGLIKILKKFEEQDAALVRIEPSRENTKEENIELDNILPDDGFTVSSFFNKIILDNPGLSDEIKLRLELLTN